MRNGVYYSTKQSIYDKQVDSLFYDKKDRIPVDVPSIPTDSARLSVLKTNKKQEIIVIISAKTTVKTRVELETFVKKCNFIIHNKKNMWLNSFTLDELFPNNEQIKYNCIDGDVNVWNMSHNNGYKYSQKLVNEYKDKLDGYVYVTLSNEDYKKKYSLLYEYNGSYHKPKKMEQKVDNEIETNIVKNLHIPLTVDEYKTDDPNNIDVPDSVESYHRYCIIYLFCFIFSFLRYKVIYTNICSYITSGSIKSSQIEELRCILIIKPHINYRYVKKIVESLKDEMFRIVEQIKRNIAQPTARTIFSSENYHESLLNDNIESTIEGESTILLLERENVYDEISYICGPVNPEQARDFAPESIRAKYGADLKYNAVHYTKDFDAFVEVHEFFFDYPIKKPKGYRKKKKKNTKQNDSMDSDDKSLSELSSTNHSHSEYGTSDSAQNGTRGVLIFKSHIKISQRQQIRRLLLDELFLIAKEIQITPTSHQLRKLLKYEGLQDKQILNQCVKSLENQTLLALLVNRDDVFEELNNIAGNIDPNVARQENPNSIRAQFGLFDVDENAVIVTIHQKAYNMAYKYFFKHGILNPSNHQIYNENKHKHKHHRSKTKRKRKKKKKHRVKMNEVTISLEGSVNSLKLPVLEDTEYDEEVQIRKGIILFQTYLSDNDISEIRKILIQENIQVTSSNYMTIPIGILKDHFSDMERWKDIKVRKLCSEFCRGSCTVFQVSNEELYLKLPKIIGKEDPTLAGTDTIRYKFGRNLVQNAVYYTSNEKLYKNLYKSIFYNDTISVHSLYLDDVVSQHSERKEDKGISLGVIADPNMNASIQMDNVSVHSYKSNLSRKSIETKMEIMVVVLKPHLKDNEIDEIRYMFKQNGYEIRKEKITFLPMEIWEVVMKDDVTSEMELRQEQEHLCSGAVTIFLVYGNDIYDEMKDLAGPFDPRTAKLQDPQSIRAKYGIDTVRNAIWFTKNEDSLQKNMDYFFDNAASSVYSNSVNTGSMIAYQKSIVVIKPHVDDNKRDEIKALMEDAGIIIKQEKWTHLTRESIHHLYKHETMGHELLNDLIKQMASGEVTAYLCIREDLYSTLNELFGDIDSVRAKKLDPNCIRALYGIDRIKNVVYFTENKKDYKSIFSYFFFVDETETIKEDSEYEIKIDDNNEINDDNDMVIDIDDVKSRMFATETSGVVYNNYAACGLMLCIFYV